jgi:NarL family two-component system response regulator LiaR
MDGVSATRAVRERCPKVQVIALTSFREGDLVRQALQAGAIGYLLKGVTMDDLATAIRSAHTGRSILSPEALQALTLSTRQAPELGQDLTERQLEVLTLMVDGLSNAEIADRLTISMSTARFHVSSILRKLGAANRAEATALAIKHRLLA